VDWQYALRPKDDYSNAIKNLQSAYAALQSARSLLANVRTVYHRRGPKARCLKGFCDCGTQHCSDGKPRRNTPVPVTALTAASPLPSRLSFFYTMVGAGSSDVLSSALPANKNWLTTRTRVFTFRAPNRWPKGRVIALLPTLCHPRIGCHPPLQAAYLSLFWRLYPQFPENIWLLYSGLFLCVLATFALFYRLCCKSGVPPPVAGLRILAWGFSLQWNSLFYGLMSDILFGLLGLILATYWTETKDTRPAPPLVSSQATSLR